MIKKSFTLSLALVMVFGFTAFNIGVHKASAVVAAECPSDNPDDCNNDYVSSGIGDDIADLSDYTESDVAAASSCDTITSFCKLNLAGNAGSPAGPFFATLNDFMSGALPPTYYKLSCTNIAIPTDRDPASVSKSYAILNSITDHGGKTSGYGARISANFICRK